MVAARVLSASDENDASLSTSETSALNWFYNESNRWLLLRDCRYVMKLRFNWLSSFFVLSNINLTFLFHFKHRLALTVLRYQGAACTADFVGILDH